MAFCSVRLGNDLLALTRASVDQTSVLTSGFYQQCVTSGSSVILVTLPRKPGVELKYQPMLFK